MIHDIVVPLAKTVNQFNDDENFTAEYNKAHPELIDRKIEDIANGLLNFIRYTFVDNPFREAIIYYDPKLNPDCYTCEDVNGEFNIRAEEKVKDKEKYVVISKLSSFLSCNGDIFITVDIKSACRGREKGLPITVPADMSDRERYGELSGLEILMMKLARYINESCYMHSIDTGHDSNNKLHCFLPQIVSNIDEAASRCISDKNMVFESLKNYYQRENLYPSIVNESKFELGNKPIIGIAKNALKFLLDDNATDVIIQFTISRKDLNVDDLTFCTFVKKFRDNIHTQNGYMFIFTSDLKGPDGFCPITALRDVSKWLNVFMVEVGKLMDALQDIDDGIYADEEMRDIKYTMLVREVGNNKCSLFS